MTIQQQPSGIVVSTAISAGGIQFNHAEGVVVSTAITAGPGSGAGGVWLNHAEGIVVTTQLRTSRHAERLRRTVGRAGS